MNESIGKRSLRVVENSKKKRKWYSLMDKLWNYQNLEQAFYDVKKNRGSHGVDKVTIKEYEIELEHNLRVLQESLRLKTYRQNQSEESLFQKLMEQNVRWEFQQ